MEAAVVGDGACASLVNTLGLGALLTAVARPVEEAVIGVEHDHVLLLIFIDPFFINVLHFRASTSALWVGLRSASLKFSLRT